MIKLLKNLAKSILPPGVAVRLRRRNARRAMKDNEMALLPALESTGCCVDIGANVGLWSATAARHFAKVVAFEPSKSLATGLQNSLPGNVEVISVALSDRNGIATFSTPILDGTTRDTRATLESTANQNGDTITETVDVRTFDSFELTNVDVIKIDVEGHEEGVLRGAEETINRDKPVLIIEIEERHHQGKSEEIAEALVAKGYDMFYMDGNALKRSFAEEIKILQNYPSGINRQINNFIFIDRKRIEFYQRKLAKMDLVIL